MQIPLWKRSFLYLVASWYCSDEKSLGHISFSQSAASVMENWCQSLLPERCTRWVGW